MKKRITKIWGVGLTLVLAASLLLSAAPVSASTLAWGDEDLPDELEGGSDVVDIAVSADGGVIYAAIDVPASPQYQEIFRSTDHGVSWSGITVKTDTTPLCVDMVAVALDDENYIAAVNSTSKTVYISDDAGANWDSLGAVANTTYGIEVIRDLAISPEKGGNHFVAVVGENATGNYSDVWHYEIGAVGAAWKNTSFATTYPGWSAGHIAGAVAFSPNFASDQVMAVVTAKIQTSIDLQVFSFNQSKWNTSAGFAGYPAAVVTHGTDANVNDLKSASIDMAPDYLGSDDAMRIVFVGTTTDNSTEDEACGIFRMDDDDVEELKVKKNIHSVDYDGTNLVAGRYWTTGVYRCADPLGSSPSVSGSTSRKGPGGWDRVVAAFAGTDVVAGTRGDESAFAISEDDGKTFTDISLIDTFLATLSDFAVTPDGEKAFLLTADNTTKDLSVWRLASSWERLLSEQDADSDYIIRMAPDDADVIYLADKDSDTIFYTSDGGETKWHKRISKENVEDLAVEGDGDVAYVLIGAHVSKSTNSGFTWATKISHKITAGGYMIVSLGEDEVLVGGDDGKVSYSTNGGTTWTKLSDGMTSGVQYISTIATGLDDGDFVFAAPRTADDYIYRWEIGEDDEWGKITADADITSAHGIYGMALQEGLLYALGGNVTTGGSMCLRSIDPTADDPSWSTMTSTTEEFSATPSALRVSAGSTKLWAIDRHATEELFSYEDTLAIVGPVSKTPRDGAEIPMNPVSGAAFQVTLTWETPSDKVRKYNLNIALDDDFDEEVLAIVMTKSTGTWDEGDIISAVVGPDASGNLSLAFMPDTSYYWKVRVASDGPVKSGWSEVRSFSIGELPEALPPVVVEQPPAPIIEVPPAPAITIEPPEIVLPPSPAVPEIVIPPAPAAPAPITPAYIWAIIIIGAILVIAVIVLIVRTRRPV